MDYQVWIKSEFEDTYTKVDCGDLGAARREIDKAVRQGGEPILTVAVPYELGIRVGEVGSEVKKDKPKPDKGSRAESKSEVRAGSTEAPGELDQGLGDHDPDSGVPGK